MVSIFFEFVRRDAQQLFFDLFNSFARCQPGTIAEPENMGVDGDGRVAKRRVEYDISGFSSDAGQRFECGAIIGNVAIVQVEQHAASCDDIFALVRNRPMVLMYSVSPASPSVSMAAGVGATG